MTLYLNRGVKDVALGSGVAAARVVVAESVQVLR
jgi:hypothetical protein